MKKCCYCGSIPVEWNHSLFSKGRQIQEEYSIQPLCKPHHRGTNGSIDAKAKEKCEYLAILEGLEHLEKNYPKTDWKQRLSYLKTKYEN